MVNDAIPLEQLRTRTQEVFGIRPCLWQLKVVQAILQGDKDIVTIAGTGMGKTLTFWMPLLFRPSGSVQIVVTPLNLIGRQNVLSLERVGIRAICIFGDSATAENFQVRAQISYHTLDNSQLSKAIEALHYQVVITSPEQLMKAGGPWQRLLRSSHFSSMIISIIFDEGRCIITWGNFRNDYGLVGRLPILLPSGTPIVIADATLPPTIFNDVKEILHFRKSDLLVFCESCDRPDISILVRPVLSTLATFRDLDFVLRDWKDGDAPPPKFLIFFDSINESVKASKHLKSLLPKQYHDKVNWYHSEMSATYKIEEYERYVKGETWGLCATDSFGMVSATLSNTRQRLT
jgi:superfamily II DNA helicase RecQ